MRIKVLVLTVLLIVANAAPALAHDHNDGVRLLTERTPTVMAGDSVWLAFNWTSRGQDVSHFTATVTANKDVTVEYPSNTVDHTGLMEGHVLSDGEVDFTAVKLTVPYDTRGNVNVTFLVTYVDEKGQDHEEKYRARMRVKRFEGVAEIHQLESEATIPTGSGAWVDIDYTTRAPRADNVRATVVHDAGLTVEYPAAAASTSLHFDDRLSRNETDTARIYVNTEGAEPGDYRLLVETTYEIDGDERVLEGWVAVTVTG